MEMADAWILTDSLHLPRGRSDPFSAAIRSTRMPIIVTDVSLPDNPIIFANEAFLKLTGYSRQEVNGRNCRFLQGPGTDPATVSSLKEAIAARTDISIDILNYKKDGTEFWNSLYISPVPNEEGDVQYFFASQVDTTDRKYYELASLNLQSRLEEQVALRTLELQNALRRSTILLHEVDHRVKNNLQMISAMLMLQSMSIEDQRIKDTLQEMLERVDAMGLVHKRLYQSDDLTEFDIAEFTGEIAQLLVGATGRDDISLAVEATSLKIKADDAAPMALVINEIITNALKHACPVGRPCRLRVTVRSTAAASEITVEDDGPGMPTGASLKENFGKSLVETLIQQLRATIAWSPADPGTVVRISLPST